MAFDIEKYRYQDNEYFTDEASAECVSIAITNDLAAHIYKDDAIALAKHFGLFDELINVAKGCTDYLGGYHDQKELEIYHHGIATVVRALEAYRNVGLDSAQVASLHSVGKANEQN